MEYLELPPTPAQLNDLRAAVGWSRLDEAALAIALPGSLWAACALDGERVVGTVRIIGDGACKFGIEDLIVLPEYQGQGIGRELMTMAMRWLDGRACDNAMVNLMCEPGKEAFYERFGFIARPTDVFGPGMTRFWKN